MADKLSEERYKGPAGGWGSVESLREALLDEGIPLEGAEALRKQNKPDGFMCVSCSWAKPAEPHLFEFCENGAKATTWEITSRKVEPAFFEQHSLAELRTWDDHSLEEAGRITHPLRYDPESDRYRVVAWEEAFREIGAELKGLDPRAVVFYTSGRASLETSYLYQLFGRLYGSNNFPDSSNMCHESTSVGLPKSIGIPVGTVLLEDFDKADCILFFGQNTTSNSPRMLHPLERASRRGVPIVTFNPLRERGLERFRNPQDPVEMATGHDQRISSHYYQLQVGGDLAAILGLCKAVIAADDETRAAGSHRVLDVGFIERHTHGFEAFAKRVRALDWREIERHSGLPRAELEEVARIYCNSNAVIANYGMGVTQHKHGVETVQMLVNLLLLRGNIGKEGAGISPVRGHSNVQGQRTVGISEKPKLVPLDKLGELYGFEPPRWEGLSTVDACKGVIDGSVRGFVSLGGNFVRAVPERAAMERAWRGLRLSVQIATKLNRSHLLPGEVTYLLPCLGRIEVDVQDSGPQACSMEDSTACIHGSRGVARPASPHLLSETKIVAELAKATLAPNPKVDWDAWVADYGRIRDAIEATYPEDFERFNERMFQPGGFPRKLAARQREWKTDSGKANFLWNGDLSSALQVEEDVFLLMTLRSNGQFNTTVYSYDDRFRGIFGSREVLMMNPDDMAALGLEEGDEVGLRTAVDDGVERRLGGLSVVPHGLPRGSLGAYYPECNVLIPLWHHAEHSKVPAAKSVPVRIERG